MEKLSELFEFELNLIDDKSIREFLVYLLDTRVPSYFVGLPSSSSQRYHPLNKEGNAESLVEHTKSVVRVLMCLISHPMVGSQIDSYNKNILIASAILHDSVKYGYGDQVYDHTIHEHPVLIKNLFLGLDLDDYMISVSEDIINLVSTHHGPWRTGKSELVLPEINNQCQWYLHLADYLASRVYIRTDYDYQGRF